MSKATDGFFEKKRVWSTTKDELLQNYLKVYFVKIFATRKDVLYIDAFAGQGVFDDGKKGSPLIAYDAYEFACDTSRKPQNVFWRFIEPKYYEQLTHNVEKIKNCETVNGTYENNVIPIISELSNGKNVFIYIDPFGVKSMNFEILREISKIQESAYSIELLINFNSFGFIREACRVLKIEPDLNNQDLTEVPDEENNQNSSVNCLNEIAGGDYWINIIHKYQDERGRCDGIAAEKEFMSIYRRNLYRLFKYVLDMPILLRDGGRPVYRMIHLTNHVDGCILMAENMLTRSKVHVAEIQRRGQPDLFANTNQDLEGNFVSEKEVSQKLLDLLNNSKGSVLLQNFLAEFYTINGALCRVKELKELLLEMEKNGIINVVRFENQKQVDKKFMNTRGNEKLVFLSKVE